MPSTTTRCTLKRTTLRLSLFILLLAFAGPHPASAQDTVPPGCQELLTNGGFESDDGWLLEVTSWPGQLVDTAAHGGQRSAFVGLTPAEANVASHSIIQQSFTLPSAAASTRLTLWLQPSGTASGDDRHYVLLQTPGGAIAAILLFDILDPTGWQESAFDLAEFAGQELILQIGIANDGADAQAALFVDDVSLLACSAEPAATDTPVPTPPPTATLEPTATSEPTAQPTPTLPPAATATPPPAATPTAPPTALPTVPPAATAAPVQPTPTATLPPFPGTDAPDQPAPLLNSQATPVLIGVLASSVVILAALAFTHRRSRD